MHLVVGNQEASVISNGIRLKVNEVGSLPFCEEKYFVVLVCVRSTEKAFLFCLVVDGVKMDG